MCAVPELVQAARRRGAHISMYVWNQNNVDLPLIANSIEIKMAFKANVDCRSCPGGHSKKEEEEKRQEK